MYFSLPVRSCVNALNHRPHIHQVMEYPAHDLPVTGLGFAPREAGVALGGYDLLAGSADYKITLFKSQGDRETVRVLWVWLVWIFAASSERWAPSQLRGEDQERRFPLLVCVTHAKVRL